MCSRSIKVSGRKNPLTSFFSQVSSCESEGLRLITSTKRTTAPIAITGAVTTISSATIITFHQSSQKTHGDGSIESAVRNNDNVNKVKADVVTTNKSSAKRKHAAITRNTKLIKS